MENSLAGLAAISKLRSKAKAAASNAGPRLAEVAGRIRVRGPGCFVGLAWTGALRRVFLTGTRLLRLFQSTHDSIGIGIENQRLPPMAVDKLGVVFIGCVFEQIPTVKLERVFRVFEH